MSGSPNPWLHRAQAKQHLHSILVDLNTPMLGQPEAFIHNKEGLYDEVGNLGEASKKFPRGGGWIRMWPSSKRTHEYCP